MNTFSTFFRSNREPLVLTGCILMAMISRFVLPPFLGHPENFAPIDATALFAGAYFGRKWLAFLLPLFSVWISDFIVNYQVYHKWVWFYEGFYWQYGFYLAVVLFSSYYFQNPASRKSRKVPIASLMVSLAFFLVSNFGVWAGPIPYPHTWNGLVLCYTMGIPFFRGTLVSDLIYSTFLFFGIEWVMGLSRKHSLKIQ